LPCRRALTLLPEVRWPRQAARHAAGLTQRAPAGPGSALGQAIVAHLAAGNTATDALQAAVGEVTGELKGLRADMRIMMTAVGNFNETLQGRVVQLEKENVALRAARGAGAPDAGKENEGADPFAFVPETAVTGKTKKVTPPAPLTAPAAKKGANRPRRS
jgi:hypothetical protein